jgi:enterochelin esterase-like enzyme
LATIAVALSCGPISGQSSHGGSLWSLRATIARATPDGVQELEDAFGVAFQEADLRAGAARPKVEGLLGLWAVKGSGEFCVGEYDAQERMLKRYPMKPLAEGSAIQQAFVELTNFTDRKYAIEQKSGDGWVKKSMTPVRTEYFPSHPDSVARPDVPQGKVIKHAWKSQIFSGTERDFWVYVPAQYSPEKPACLVVFQDGESYLKGGADVPTVYDNLIHRGELPVTACVFINPGVIPRASGQPIRNRSVEYDTLSDAYARFLRDEILPEVGKSVNLRTDPASRGICGRSSGGICAFTVAWETPDQFGKVLSTIGSFTNIRGGDVYPGRIRKNPPKPIRVFLQDGSQDLDNEHGNWWLANQQMAKALAFKGYDYTFVTGEGFHSGKHETAILPDALRWLWRDWRP